MRLLVTGASGFIGQQVVLAAVAGGHDVHALVRNEASAARSRWQGNSGVKVCVATLNDAAALDRALQGVNAVVHLAAGAGNDAQSHAQVTLAGTRSLIDAMRRQSVPRLVGVSSFSVYDYSALSTGALLDERSPLVAIQPAPQNYAAAKRTQEELFREFAEAPGASVVIVRPAAVYSAARPWTALLGKALGPVLWSAQLDAPLAVVQVDDCAAALVMAATRAEASGSIVNLVESPGPLRRDYAAAVRANHGGPSTVFPLPVGLLSQIGRLLRALGVTRLPGLLDQAELDARFKPLRFSHAAASAALGWQPHNTAPASLQRPSP